MRGRTKFLVHHSTLKRKANKNYQNLSHVFFFLRIYLSDRRGCENWLQTNCCLFFTTSKPAILHTLKFSAFFCPYRKLILCGFVGITTAVHISFLWMIHDIFCVLTEPCYYFTDKNSYIFLRKEPCTCQILWEKRKWQIILG